MRLSALYVDNYTSVLRTRQPLPLTFYLILSFSVVKQQLGNARSVGHAHTGSAACGRYARTPRLGRHAPDRRTASRRMHCGRTRCSSGRPCFAPCQAHRARLRRAPYQAHRARLRCTPFPTHRAHLLHAPWQAYRAHLRFAPWQVYRAHLLRAPRPTYNAHLRCVPCQAYCARLRHAPRPTYRVHLHHAPCQANRACAPDQAHRAHLRPAPCQAYRALRTRSRVPRLSSPHPYYLHWPCTCIAANTAAAEP